MSNELKSIKTIFYQKDGISIDQFLFKKNNSFSYVIPEKVTNQYKLITKKWEDKEKNNSFKNSENLCVSKYLVKDKKIYLDLCEEKYLVKQVISETLGTMTQIEQDFLLSEIQNNKTKIPLSYKITVGVISKDGKLLIAKRSSKVSTNKSKFDFTITKSVDPKDYSGKSFQPLNTVIRAVNEELNISIDKKEVIKNDMLKLKEVYINREIFSLNIFVILDLRKGEKDYSFKNILELSKSSKNSWEISDISSIELSKKDILKFLKSNENKITNYSFYNMIKLADQSK